MLITIGAERVNGKLQPSNKNRSKFETVCPKRTPLEKARSSTHALT